MTSYFTHDNGDRPFEVIILKKGKALIQVRRIPYEKAPYEVVGELVFKKMWMGRTSYSAEDDFAKGNSFLFRLSESTYVFVSDLMMEFILPRGEKVTGFVGDVGNSDVVYAYAITNKRILFLSDRLKDSANAVLKKWMPKDVMSDAYDQLYNNPDVKSHLERLKIKVIEPRPQMAWFEIKKKERNKILKRLGLE